MIQAGEILDCALALMDEAGADADRELYEERALELIRVLAAEKRVADGKRGWFMPIDELEDPVEEVEEGYAIGVMPYGLAAVLLIPEDPSSAAFFQERFEELRDRYKARREAEEQAIEDLYGCAELGEYGSW